MGVMVNSKYSSDPLGYYKILEVSNTSSDEEIKLSYRDKAKFWHPDHSTAENAQEKFQLLSEAYDVLKDKIKRKLYNLSAIAYNKSDYPDLSLLKPYKSKAYPDDLSLRVLSLTKNTGLLTKYTSDKTETICNEDEAKKIVLKTAFHNLFLGWWHGKLFSKNPESIKENIENIDNNNQANLTLLVHNAIAYFNENEHKKSFVMLKQAFDFANEEQKKTLEEFANILEIDNDNVENMDWEFKTLKHLQFAPYIVLLLAVIFSSFNMAMSNEEVQKWLKEGKNVPYYQKVVFNNNQETFDDVVVSKVFNLPIDKKSTKYLYHVDSEVTLKYGPSDEFDDLKTIEENTTVRLTGYTPDKKWMRIMIDNGEMGFVKPNVLKKGSANKIPFGSKIFDTKQKILYE